MKTKKMRYEVLAQHLFKNNEWGQGFWQGIAANRAWLHHLLLELKAESAESNDARWNAALERCLEELFEAENEDDEYFQNKCHQGAA